MFDYNKYFLASITNDYDCLVICDRDLSLPTRRKVGKGGVAILCHKRLSQFITPLTIDDDRIACVQVQLSPGLFLFVFQVYLPYSNHPVEIYRHYIDTLYDLYNMYCTQGIAIFLGDYNAS